ncbi:hypothetical protein KR215_005944 [Drosophila sulfurigaster]|nr:hypothetical protein KR215_005944 [Drosophila sulfurigaster]
MWKLRFAMAWRAVMLLLVCAAATTAADFGYGVHRGPGTWARDYEQCNGKHQSPININKMEVIKMEYPEINYYNFDLRPKSVTLTNNGHTVLVTMNFTEGKEPRLSGGPLVIDAVYQFEQFHFHWGENDTLGSEDMINNQRYPAELHVVMRSLKYSDLTSALDQEQGVVVLAFFFKVVEKPLNPYYGEFVEILSLIRGKDSSKNLVEPLPLWKFLSTYSTTYYSYIGSLTTPPCSEEVLWIDYQDAIYISEYQLNLFRNLTASDEHLKNNFRPIQKLNDRLIYENVPKDNLQTNWMPPPSAAPLTSSLNVIILLGISMPALLQGHILVDF